MKASTPANPARPPLWFAILCIPLYFALQFIGVQAVAAIAMAQNPALASRVEANATGALAELIKETAIAQIGSVSAAAILICLLIFAFTKSRKPVIILGLRRKSALPVGQTLKITIVAIVCAMLCLMAWGAFLQYWKGPNFEAQANFTEVVGAIPKTGMNFAIMAASITVFGPLAEEVMFRGLLQSALLRYVKPGIAITLSAAIFGMSHLQPYAFPVLFCLGIALGYIYHRTGSLLLVFGLHFANNMVALSFS